jgi:hypothetical protein
MYTPQDSVVIAGRLDGLESAITSLRDSLNASWEDALSQSLADVSLEKTNHENPSSKDRAWLVMCFQQIKQSMDGMR